MQLFTAICKFTWVIAYRTTMKLLVIADAIPSIGWLPSLTANQLSQEYWSQSQRSEKRTPFLSRITDTNSPA